MVFYRKCLNANRGIGEILVGSIPAILGIESFVFTQQCLVHSSLCFVGGYVLNCQLKPSMLSNRD